MTNHDTQLIPLNESAELDKSVSIEFGTDCNFRYSILKVVGGTWMRVRIIDRSWQCTILFKRSAVLCEDEGVCEEAS